MNARILFSVLAVVVALAVAPSAFAWTHNEHVHNNTGQVVNDVHKVLNGQWDIPEMMTTTFANTEWYYDPADDKTYLTWWGDNLPHCEYAHCCFTAQDPVTGNAAPGGIVERAYFTFDGDFVGDLGPVASAQGRGEQDVFVAEVGNFHMLEGDPMMPAPPIEVLEIAIGFVDTCLPIEDLVFELLYGPDSGIDWIPLPPMTLADHGVWYPVVVPMQFGAAAAVLRMTLDDGTDPDNPYHEFHQFTLTGGAPSATEEGTWSKIKGIFR
jgi:hypothetical protein